MLERTFETKSGQVLHFVPLSPMLYQTLEIEWLKKKPEAPIVTVYIDDKPRTERNYDDPDHADRIRVWELEKQEDLLTVIFALGLTDEVPADTAERYRRRFPDANDEKIKYYWVTSIVDITTELDRLTEAILGQTMATDKGLEQSKEVFQSID